MKGLLSAEECKEIFNKIVGMTSGAGDTTVSIVSQYSGSARWARNKIYVASEARNIDIRITRFTRDPAGFLRVASGSSNTTCLDDAGLRQAVREAETVLQVERDNTKRYRLPFNNDPSLNPKLWSESTYGFEAGARAELIQEIIKGAESASVVSAGNMLIAANGTASMSTDGMFRYYPQTVVEYSLTVRHPRGLGSGWAGVNHYDLARIEPKAIAAIALDKCLRSANPVAVEPGRYTVIMEPQATADLFKPIIDPIQDLRYSSTERTAVEREIAESPMGPFGKGVGLSKITEQVLDRRLNVIADTMDIDGGFLPYERYNGVPYQAVNWIEQGVLRELAYSKYYALASLGLDKALLNPHSFKLTAAPGVTTTTVEDMISKTERGLLVTRFSNVEIIDFTSMLCGGYTRDGVWLIEKGKITKPVKNFRFTESPLFALNNLEDIGVSKRVFAPGVAHMAPAVRVRDFSMTSLADAI